MRVFRWVTLTACLLLVAQISRADNVSCVADGSGVDTCVIKYPDVLHGSVTYPGVPIVAGDRIFVTAAGCAQTGGSGKTWKRYLDPSGDNSDRLYHGLIQVPGHEMARIQNTTVPVIATGSGPLKLGYEDNGYEDNGYWSHDDGTDNQCSDQNTTNRGRAFVTVIIVHAAAPFAPAATAYGQCVTGANGVLNCHIDRPDVTHSSETFPAIQFLDGDQVMVTAGGCVQTGGHDKTWKNYLNPSGANSGSLYHGLISIPGATNAPVRLNTVVGTTLTASAGGLVLGYEDNEFSDNGYWNHDDGTENQCAGIGPAFLDIAITHAPMPQGAHVNLDGIEVVQAIQDLNESVPLVAGKNTWARAYLSGTVSPGLSLRGSVNAQMPGSAPTSLVAAAPLSFSNDGINARRARWSGSLNFLLPASLTSPGNLALTLDSVWTLDLSHPGEVRKQTVLCNQCSTSKTVIFMSSPLLRVRAFNVTYQAPVGPAKTQTTFVPRAADTNLLLSWLSRAYPTAGIQSSSATITGTIKPPFNDDTCSDVDSQLHAVRSNDMSNQSVDSLTHYYGLVSDSAGVVQDGFMRGCSDIAESPDPGAVGSGPAGQGQFGDLDASYADWYGGHELGHTFGRKHPGFCGETRDDPNYPFPNGTISDTQGSFVGLDVGDATVETNTGAIIGSMPAPGVTPVPLKVLPGTTTNEIMTYCPQPEWLSSYTFSAIRDRLGAEGGSSSGAGSAGGEGSPGTEPLGAVQVIAQVDLTAKTGMIKYVLPVVRVERQPRNVNTAELAVIVEGRVISRTQAALRILSDRKPGDHVIALIDASVPVNAKMEVIQLIFEKMVLAEFRSNYRKPAAPTSAKIVRTEGNLPSSKLPSYQLVWNKASERLNRDEPIFYTVEVLVQEKWETIAVGLTEPSIDITAEQAKMTLRIKATNGFLNSLPLVIRPGVTVQN